MAFLAKPYPSYLNTAGFDNKDQNEPLTKNIDFQTTDEHIVYVDRKFLNLLRKIS